MAPHRQPPYQHSCLLDNDRLFADSLPVWIPSYGNSSSKSNPQMADTDDFEIDWPMLDRYNDDLDSDIYQSPVLQNVYNKRTPAHYKKVHRSAQAYVLPGSRPFLNTTSKQANMRSRPTPAPLVLSMSAFKRDHLRVPPAPPPSPTLTPPPTPPFCPLYEEHQTLGAFDIPAISLARPNHGVHTTRTLSNGELTPTSPQLAAYYSSEEPSTDIDDEDRDFDTLCGSSMAGSTDEYDFAPPPPSIQLYRTTSQPPAPLRAPRRMTSSETISASRSSPATPTIERRPQKSGLSASYFDWDPEPETASITTTTTQWSKFRSSRNRDKRRGSESDESHSSRGGSVREKAERLRRKLEGVFGKK
ncbi:hypothetical protein H072_8890 [Dactylellina haptotyla CBS 200.50]|uniref:Uncharacterized protein n=1 Tax=Dactylellina haptotyla (strain CBS 200.50) TaxID=1284197 RepID=S8A3T0_DACHA|nr:hypothetical protein H072_8890 [Dactylellina haptotyla CBS 200.50]